MKKRKLVSTVQDRDVGYYAWQKENIFLFTPQTLPAEKRRAKRAYDEDGQLDELLLWSHMRTEKLRRIKRRKKP